MPSELNHIDDFIRSKESESVADTGSQEQHWEQMKKMMAAPTSFSWKGRLPWKALSALFLVPVVLLIVWNNYSKQENAAGIKINHESAWQSPAIIQKDHAPVPVHIRPASPDLPPKKHLKLASFATFNMDTLAVKDSSAILANSVQTLNAFFESMQPPAQEFTVDADRDTTLVGAQGTKVLIRAGSFIAQNGKVVHGSLTFLLRECYSVADMISNRLSTTSFGQPLSTGGMIQVEARMGDQVVKLIPDKPIEVKMPASPFDPSMQLFTGIKDQVLRSDDLSDTSTSVIHGINWNGAGQRQLFLNGESRLISVIDLSSDPRSVHRSNGKLVAKYVIPFDCALSTQEVKNRLEQKFGAQYEIIKVRRQWKPLNRNNALREKYGSANNSLVGDSIRIDLSMARKLKLISVADSLKFEEGFRKDFDRIKGLQGAYDQSVQVKKEYSFFISNMGWINCDRFLDLPLTQLDVVPGKSFEQTWFQSFLVFPSIRSLLAGDWSNGVISFTNVPLGQQAHLVCIGIKNGRAYAAIKKITISREKITDLEFVETDPSGFRKKMEEFGRVN